MLKLWLRLAWIELGKITSWDNEDIQEEFGFLEAYPTFKEVGKAIASCSRPQNAPETVKLETEMEEAAFHLRRLRKEIYSSLDLKKIKNYRHKVNKFVKNFKGELSNWEVSTWKKKITETEKEVKKILKEKENSKPYFSDCHIEDNGPEYKVKDSLQTTDESHSWPEVHPKTEEEVADPEMATYNGGADMRLTGQFMVSCSHCHNVMVSF